LQNLLQILSYLMIKRLALSYQILSVMIEIFEIKKGIL